MALFFCYAMTRLEEECERSCPQSLTTVSQDYPFSIACFSAPTGSDETESLIGEELEIVWNGGQRTKVTGLMNEKERQINKYEICAKRQKTGISHPTNEPKKFDVRKQPITTNGHI